MDVCATDPCPLALPARVTVDHMARGTPKSGLLVLCPARNPELNSTALGLYFSEAIYAYSKGPEFTSPPPQY